MARKGVPQVIKPEIIDARAFTGLPKPFDDAFARFSFLIIEHVGASYMARESDFSVS
jgi:hypothetical protein